MAQESEFKKNLNPASVWAIAFGCIIGWGSFINPGKKFLFNSGVAGTAIAMALGGVIMLIIAYNYGYMVPKFPTSGGEFTYAKACFGKTPAFFCGWFLVVAYLTNVPMNSTAIGLIVDGLFGPILKFGFHYTIAGFDIYMGEMLFAMVVLVLFYILSVNNVEVAGSVETCMAIILGVSVIVLGIVALCSPYAKVENLFPLWGFDKNAALADAAKGAYVSVEKYAFISKSQIATSILATLTIAPWAYVGFASIPQAAEEFNFSFKKVIFIMVIAIIFGGSVYIVNNTVTAAALEKWPDLIVYADKTPWLLMSAAERMMGVFGKVLVGLGVSSAVLTGILGFYMTSSRLMYSMAKDGFLPSVFAKLDSKNGTPKNAMLFCLLVSLSGPILGREALGWFVDMSAIGASFGYGFTSLATIKVLKKDENAKSFLKLTSFAGVFFSFMFVFLQIVPIKGLSGVHFCKQSYIMLIIWTFMGLIFYMMERKNFKNSISDV